LANAAAARDLARRTNVSQPMINAELNRLAGLRRITEATVPPAQSPPRPRQRWLARV